MMDNSSEERFKCAVEVIQSLPKKGSFQPSHEMMLRFYSLYKQANLGPCTDAKPSFWDPVGRAKHDAWSSLGNMSKEDAMCNYVEELKKIVEVMPQTEVVGNFTRTLGRFYEIVDIEKPAALKRNSPSPGPALTPTPSEDGRATRRSNKHDDDKMTLTDDDDDSNEKFSDTVDTLPVRITAPENNSMTLLQSEISSISLRLSSIEQSLAALVAASNPRHQQQQRAQNSLTRIVRIFTVPRRLRQLIIFLLPLIAAVFFARRYRLVRR